MPVMGAKELSMLVTSLARLEYRPPEAWLQSFAKASQKQMSSFGAQVCRGGSAHLTGWDRHAGSEAVAHSWGAGPS
jgi:hypothetical protein